MTPCKSLAAAALVALFGSNTAITVAADLFTHGDVTLFNGPGNRFAPRGRLAPGMPITILWCNGAADWCMVQSREKHGWAPMSDIVADGDDKPSDTPGPGAVAPPAAAGAPPPASLAGAAAGGAAGVGATLALDGNSGVSISASAGRATLGVKLP